MTSVHTGKVSEFATTVTKTILTSLQGTTLQNQKSGKLRITRQAIRELGLEQLSLSTNGDSIVLHLEKFYMRYFGHARYKKLLVKINANLHVTISNCNLTIGIRPRVNNGAFAFEVTSTWVHIGKLKLKATGGIIARIGSLFLGLFKGVIRKLLNKVVQSTLSKQVHKLALQSTSTLPASAPVGSGHRMSLALTGINLANNAITVGFDGGIDGVSVSRPSYAQDPTDNLFSVVVGVWALNQLVELGRQKVNLNLHLDNVTGPKVVPSKYMSFDLKSSFYPEVVHQSWGINIPVVDFKLGTPEFIANNGVFAFKTPFDHTVTAYDLFTGQAVQVISNHHCEFIAGANAQFNERDGQYYIVPRIAGARLDCHAIEGNQFATDIYTGLWNWFANHIVIGHVNSWMKNGVVVPKVHGLSLSNPNFVFIDNAIGFKTDMSLSP